MSFDNDLNREVRKIRSILAPKPRQVEFSSLAKIQFWLFFGGTDFDQVDDYVYGIVGQRYVYYDSTTVVA